MESSLLFRLERGPGIALQAMQDDSMDVSVSELWELVMDREAWSAAIHGVTKSRTRLSDFTFPFHALEKEMATHSSVLAWRIPGTGEPCGLPSMRGRGLERNLLL